MAHRFDPVAIGVAHESAIMGLVIVAQARRAVIAAARRYSGVPEGIDLGPPLRLEAPVAAGGVFGFWGLADGEVDALRISGARALAIAQPVIAAADLDDLEHFHDRVVERLGGGDIRYGDGNMVQHRAFPTRWRFR